MSSERESTRAVLSWLREPARVDAERVIARVLGEVELIPQRRALVPARRYLPMNNIAKTGIAAAAVLVFAVVGYNLLPRTGGPGGPSTPAPTTQPTLAPSPGATSGSQTVTITPFGPDKFGMCPPKEVDSECVEDPRDEGMTFTLDLPAGWELSDSYIVQPVDAPLESELGGAGVLITRGSWLYSEPCRPDEEVNPDIPVGPTADDFVTALDAHPLLDVSVGFIKGIGGYTGTYLQLQVPDDISGCVIYHPIEQTIYAQGPGHIWDLWVLDVDGIRVVVQATSFPNTTAQHQAELQAVVDSIQITP